MSSMTAALDSTVSMGCIINFAFFKQKRFCYCRGCGVLHDGSPGLPGVDGLHHNFKQKLCCCCRGCGVLHDGRPGLPGVDGLHHNFKQKLCCCCRGCGVLHDGSPGLHGVDGLFGREGEHLRPSPGMALRGGLFYQQGRAVLNHKIINQYVEDQ